MVEKLNKSKVVQYKLVKAEIFTNLSERVNEAIQEGWEIWGSPGIACDEEDNHYIQAMVKYD